MKLKFYLYFILIILLSITLTIAWREDNAIFYFLISLFIPLFYAVHKDFFQPLDRLNKQVLSYQNNPKSKNSIFSQVEDAIDHLVDENQSLYDDMEMVLNKQVQRLSKKTASLEILYGVAEKINTISDKKELFKQFLDIFINMSAASGGMVREFVAGKMQLVAQKNASISDIEIMAQSPCAQADGVQFSVYDCPVCTKQDNIGTVFIPLNYKNKNLGAFALFFQEELSLAYDERVLMQAIADNIALYLDKLQQQEKAKIHELNQERLHISQDIHDSLAQTIYSMNLEISVLKAMSKDSKINDKIDILQQNVSQANKELRALIGNFREPSVEKKNTYTIKKIIDNFEKNTKIKLYSQIDNLQLDDEVIIQITQIISEALANIKKHSNANVVRIICSNSQLLIEDDGIGFEVGDKKDGHIGLEVMRERAARIRAKLYIESNKEDGTIIIVNYENN